MVRIIARVKGILAADNLDFKLLKENKKKILNTWLYLN